MVHHAVALDAEDEDTGLGGMTDADVDAVARRADLRLHEIAPGADGSDYRVLERAVGVTSAGTDVQGEGFHAALGEVEVRGEVADTLVGRVGNVARADGRDDLDALARSGDRDVEAPPALGLVQGTEVAGDLAMLVRTVPDGKDDDVPLVALYGFEALGEEAVEPVSVEVTLKVGPLDQGTVQGRLDGVSLGDGEGDDAEGRVRPGAVVVQDALDNLRRFDEVVAAGPPDGRRPARGTSPRRRPVRRSGRPDR